MLFHMMLKYFLDFITHWFICKLIYDPRCLGQIIQSASGGITLGQWRRTNWYEWSSLLLVHIRIRMLKWITRVDTRPAFKDTGWTGPIERKPFLVLPRSSVCCFLFYAFHSSHTLGEAEHSVPSSFSLQDLKRFCNSTKRIIC